jgi:hypothetical protein
MQKYFRRLSYFLTTEQFVGLLIEPSTMSAVEDFKRMPYHHRLDTAIKKTAIYMPEERVVEDMFKAHIRECKLDYLLSGDKVTDLITPATTFIKKYYPAKTGAHSTIENLIMETVTSKTNQEIYALIYVALVLLDDNARVLPLPYTLKHEELEFIEAYRSVHYTSNIPAHHKHMIWTEACE